MNRLYQTICFFVLTIICSCSHEPNNEFYLPAEWEPQSGIIVSDIQDPCVVEMMRNLSKKINVYCFIVDSMEETAGKQFTTAGIVIDSIRFIPLPADVAPATRDGLFFLKNQTGDVRIVDFQWNAYGWYLQPRFKDLIEGDKKNRESYKEHFRKIFSHPVITSTMVNEAGAIEVNGKGTALQVESVNMQRNPGMSKEQQEAELKRVLNVKKVIWLKEGAAEDPAGYGTLITQNYFGVGVGGHVDEFCRFVNDSTILLSFPDSLEAEHDPVKRITLKRMEVNYEILRTATDQDGNPFTIVKVPVPDIEYTTITIDTATGNERSSFLSRMILYEQKGYSVGDTVHFVPSSSYLNFLVTNTAVLEAKYWKEGMPETSKAKDERVKTLLEKYFPGREIVQIDPTSLNYVGGGMHCWTMQVPKE